MSAADLEVRLAAARRTRGELAAAKAERDVEAELLAQVEAEERAAKDEAAIAAAETEHGPVGRKIAVVDTDLGVVIVKRANAVLFRRFQDSAGDAKVTDLEKLVRPCLVYPDVAAFDRILDELPATLTRVANAVVVLAGARAKEVSGK